MSLHGNGQLAGNSYTNFFAATANVQWAMVSDSSTVYGVSLDMTGLIFKKTRRRHKQCHIIKWPLVVLSLSVGQNKYKVMKAVGAWQTVIH